jgi:hypothetical protein
VPGSARLMRIMAKKVYNRVGLVKLPDECYSQLGRDTFLELCRVNFRDFRLTDGWPGAVRSG